jgi:hypothetical protein
MTPTVYIFEAFAPTLYSNTFFDIYIYIYIYMALFCLFMLYGLCYKCIYMCVCFFIFTCVKNANIIYD